MAQIKTDQELLLEFGLGIIEDMRARHRAAGQRASGATEESLRPEAKTTTLNIFGSAAWLALDKGRGKTTRGGGGGGRTVQQQIYEWLGFKKYGLTFANDKERVGLSYAIATNIHKLGNFAKRKNLQSGVVTNAVTPDRIRAFLGTFGRNSIARMGREIQKAHRA